MDYAAATPVDDKVLAAMLPYFSDKFFNPSAAYTPARNVRTDFEAARHRIAQIVGARPAEIIMTAGATESINLALHSFCHPELVSGSSLYKENAVDSRVKHENDVVSILTTAIEHPAVLETARAAGAKFLPVDKFGRVDPAIVRKYITDDIKLISVGYANNEIGTVQPLKEIAEIVAAVRSERAQKGVKTPLLFHTDASQAAGYLDLNVARLGVDLMTLNAGKGYGPKQVGCLFVRAGVKLQPLLSGGGQEMNLRSGTENVAGAVGFAGALEIAEKHRKSEVKRLEELRDDLENYLLSVFASTAKQPNRKDCHSEFISESSLSLPEEKQKKLKIMKPQHQTRGCWARQVQDDKSKQSVQNDKIIINGHKKYHLPNILNFSVPGLDGERAVFALDERGVMVATGSACAANKGTRSHVLTAIGLSENLIDGSLRISLGRPTTKTEIEQLKPILIETLREQLKFGSQK